MWLALRWALESNTLPFIVSTSTARIGKWKLSAPKHPHREPSSLSMRFSPQLG